MTQDENLAAVVTNGLALVVGYGLRLRPGLMMRASARIAPATTRAMRSIAGPRGAWLTGPPSSSISRTDSGRPYLA